jgi:hypothetical protein
MAEQRRCGVAVSPDGQRFLMLKNAQQTQEPSQINVVLNWVDELKATR